MSFTYEGARATERHARLDYYYRTIHTIILKRQNPVTGLIPASTAVTSHGDYRDAWVRDNVYSILAVFGLALAYRRIDDDQGKAYELEHSCIKLMRGLLAAMMKQAHKVERFKETQSIRDALHAKYNTATGDIVVGDGEWGHLQIDATSLFLLTLAQMTAAGFSIIYTQDEVDFVQNLVFYVETAYRTPDFGLWERGNKMNHGEPELNSSSIGMVVAALEALNGLNLFGPRGGPTSVIHVLPDEVERNAAVLASALPRESKSKEVDAALLSVVGYPAFAVSDVDLALRTQDEIIRKLGGRYGCKRFLRDGHQTAVEDTSRLHYEPSELRIFEGIESEWPLFFTYLILNGIFSGDTDLKEKYQAALAPLIIHTRDEETGDVVPLIPELYYVPEDRIQAEKADPHSQDRLRNENLPLVWANSLYFLGCLVDEGLVSVAELDPLDRRSRVARYHKQQLLARRVDRPFGHTHYHPSASAASSGVVLQISLLAEDRTVQRYLSGVGIETETVGEIGAVRVLRERALREVYSMLGDNEKLGLSGRPPRPVGTLGTCRLYRAGGRVHAFTPRFLDAEHYYLTSDNEYLVALFEQECAFVGAHWKGPGRPVMTLMLTRAMLAGAKAARTTPSTSYFSSSSSSTISLDTRDGASTGVGRQQMAVVRLMLALKEGMCNGVRVRLGRLGSVVPVANVESLDFLSDRVDARQGMAALVGTILSEAEEARAWKGGPATAASSVALPAPSSFSRRKSISSILSVEGPTSTSLPMDASMSASLSTSFTPATTRKELVRRQSYAYSDKGDDEVYDEVEDGETPDDSDLEGEVTEASSEAEREDRRRREESRRKRGRSKGRHSGSKSRLASPILRPESDSYQDDLDTLTLDAKSLQFIPQELDDRLASASTDDASPTAPSLSALPPPPTLTAPMTPAPTQISASDYAKDTEAKADVDASVTQDAAAEEVSEDGDVGVEGLSLTLGDPSQVEAASSLLLPGSPPLSLYDRVDLLHYLHSCLGPDYLLHGLGRTIGELIEEAYGKATRTRAWSVARQTAGLAGKVMDGLGFSLSDLLVRQRHVTLGVGERELAVDGPLSSRELAKRIYDRCVEDVREGPLVQEVLTFLANVARGSPRLLHGIMRFRTHYVIIALREEAGRRAGCVDEESALEALFQSSPSAIQALLVSVLSRHGRHGRPKKAGQGQVGRDGREVEGGHAGIETPMGGSILVGGGGGTGHGLGVGGYHPGLGPVAALRRSETLSFSGSAGSSLSLHVTSAGFAAGNTVSIKLVMGGGGVRELSTGGRGINAIVLDGGQRAVVLVDSYDTHADPRESQRLEGLIQNLSPGMVIVLAVKDEGSECLGEGARKAIETLGSRDISRFSYRDAWCFIARRGRGAPGEAGAGGVVLAEAYAPAGQKEDSSACGWDPASAKDAVAPPIDGRVGPHTLTLHLSRPGEMGGILVKKGEGLDGLGVELFADGASEIAGIAPADRPSSTSPSLLGPSEGRWIHQRRKDGALNRVPPHFYPRVWGVLARSEGLRVRQALLPRDPTTSDKTAEEYSFALVVELLLDVIRDPAERQIAVEALMAIADLEEIGPLAQDPEAIDASGGYKGIEGGDGESSESESDVGEDYTEEDSGSVNDWKEARSVRGPIDVLQVIRNAIILYWDDWVKIHGGAIIVPSPLPGTAGQGQGQSTVPDIVQSDKERLRTCGGDLSFKLHERLARRLFFDLPPKASRTLLRKSAQSTLDIVE